jgi:hypothetical protein
MQAGLIADLIQSDLHGANLIETQLTLHKQLIGFSLLTFKFSSLFLQHSISIHTPWGRKHGSMFRCLK